METDPRDLTGGSGEIQIFLCPAKVEMNLCATSSKRGEQAIELITFVFIHG